MSQYALCYECGTEFNWTKHESKCLGCKPTKRGRLIEMLNNEVEPWEPSTFFEVLAVSIGHHFWDIEDDVSAYKCGYDAACYVQKLLKEVHGYEC